MDALSIVITLLAAVLGLVILYFIIKAAVLAAIREARADGAETPTPPGGLTPGEQRLLSGD